MNKTTSKYDSFSGWGVEVRVATPSAPPGSGLHFSSHHHIRLVVNFFSYAKYNPSKGCMNWGILENIHTYHRHLHLNSPCFWKFQNAQIPLPCYPHCLQNSNHSNPVRNCCFFFPVDLNPLQLPIILSLLPKKTYINSFLSSEQAMQGPEQASCLAFLKRKTKLTRLFFTCKTP